MKTTPLLGANEPAPFELHNPGGEAPLLIVCDHASRRVPDALDNLGLAPEHFAKHIAYDIGAATITRCLAERLNARAVLSAYSRLVVDLNRQPNDPGAIPAISDTIPIPGNQNLSAAQIALRIATLHRPYHDAIRREIASLRQQHGQPPVLFSVHSFTPSLNGQDRIWHIGVLWNKDPRLPVALIERLRQWRDLTVGDNEPYSGRELAYTIDSHGLANGIANCAVEIRQDRCATLEESSHWADILADALRPILDQPGIHALKRY